MKSCPRRDFSWRVHFIGGAPDTQEGRMHREPDCDTKHGPRYPKGEPTTPGGSDGASRDADRQRRISCVDLGGGDIEAPSTRVPRASPCLPNNAQSARAQTRNQYRLSFSFFSRVRSFILACTRGGARVWRLESVEKAPRTKELMTWHSSQAASSYSALPCSRFMPLSLELSVIDCQLSIAALAPNHCSSAIREVWS